MVFHILSDDFWNRIFELHGNSGGAYKIIAYQNAIPVPIPRWLGTDTEGVLYIGKADSFIDRVIKFKRAVQRPTGKGHSGCRSYRFAPIIAQSFPYTILYAELIPSLAPAQTEKDLIKQYVCTFGEVPPLNSHK